MANPVGIGYPDGQRVSNLDGPLVINTSETDWTGAWSPPANIDVSRYDGIQIGGTCTLGAVALYLQWSADQAGQIILGERTIVISANMGQRFAFNVRNLGPWLNVTVTAIQAQASTFSLAAMPSNRTGSVEGYASAPTLIQQGGVSIPAGATTGFYPSSYYGGPVRVYIGDNDGGCYYTFKTETAESFQYIIDQVHLTSAAVQTESMVVPLGLWWLEVYNPNATADTVSVTVTPSPTGSL